MINIKDIVSSINGLLKTKFPDIKRQSTDIKEGFLRPSFFVEIDSNKSGQQNEIILQKKVGIRIYYFPTDEHNCRVENLEMQDSLDSLFADGFWINDTYINLDEDGIEHNVTDGILQSLFYVNYMNENDPDADFDYMEELDIDNKLN